MAVRNDFTAGEVLAAADLNDTFGSRVPFQYGTATPTTTVEGFVWYDENFTPPTPKFWDGSEFRTFSAGAADFSNAASGTYTDGGVSYKFLTFNASGTLTVTKAGFADVLVIGGGGGGGSTSAIFGGGGGGAGGYLDYGNAFLPAGTLTVVVGAGGAGRINMDGITGTTSRLDSLYGVGGGLGIRGINFAGGVGGSGGGGAGSGAGGTSTSGQGSDGGAGNTDAGGGGGGASAAGANATNGGGGAGGNGSASSITGSSVTRAGGGGGGGGSTSGAGGSGGGGAGSTTTTPTSGTANTGGGGGGYGGGAGVAGGAGGSGVVIVRVKV
jgi:hypothetical protein